MMGRRSIAALVCAQIACAGTAFGQQHQCQRQVEHRLEEYKLTYNEMKNPQWVTQNSERRGADSLVLNHTVYLQPPSCSSGDLVVVLSDDCYIQQAYTVHGCRVKGVPSY